MGGCGLGLGYISPVSTLIKWFPDERGMAPGMAIMGFGGVPAAHAYNTTMYLLAALLVIGFVANALVQPVQEASFMTEQELEVQRPLAHETRPA